MWKHKKKFSQHLNFVNAVCLISVRERLISVSLSVPVSLSLSLSLSLSPTYDATTSSEPGPPHYRSSTITLRHTTLSRNPLDELSARFRDLYLVSHNTHNRHTCTLAGYEPTIPASQMPQTHALDRAATGVRIVQFKIINYITSIKLDNSILFCHLFHVSTAKWTTWTYVKSGRQSSNSKRAVRSVRKECDKKTTKAT